MEANHFVDQLAKQIGAEWPNISIARRRTTETLKNINDALGATGEDGVPLFSMDEVSVIAFGSLARQEFTQGSDLDWTLLVDGPVDPDHLMLRKEVEQKPASLRF